jgi:transcriptional regulator with XRE-family HTH domain
MSFRTLLPEMLRERGLSYRQFAKEIDFEQAYLSRTINGERSPSKKFLEAVSRALSLPDDYFPEYRQHVVIEAIKKDARLRDKIYDSLTRKGN